MDLEHSAVEGRKRGDPEVYDKAIERRLRRKMKNRESATKASYLEEQNIRLKKEKEFDSKVLSELSAGSNYQLRRTSSAYL
ncbi:hypothetical protein SAY87_019485 [Trapa incisa]|uniref:BZIP domain-containing protein n=1 Tax=Trapa incisa TaxID=236973 RepID=A0AAN7K2D0_9MYRT|nr:hypothetical protein SAY87_019485 [Trapa incisa]